jgi:hypothetical protein
MNDDKDNSIRIYLSADLAFQNPVGKTEQISKDDKTHTHKQNTK